MSLKFPSDTLVVASLNPGKARELVDLLSSIGLKTTTAAALGLAEPEETGKSFKDNAEIKSTAAVRATGLAALADDSGLVVPALQDQPGVYSARWAGENKDFYSAMERIHRELGSRDRHAYFVCALSLALPSGEVYTFEGRVDGHLVWPPRGEMGFGYDPMFVPAGHDLTFGEMDPAIKHSLSHRAQAFEKLCHFLSL